MSKYLKTQEEYDKEKRDDVFVTIMIILGFILGSGFWTYLILKLT